MTDEKKPKDLSAERARELILKRRARFMAAALAGLSGLSCDDGGPSVCLSLVAPDAGEPDVCLSMRGPDAGKPRDGGPRLNPDGGPRVCLQPIRHDAGPDDDAGPSDAGGKDAGVPDAGDLDSGPRVCLILVVQADEDDETLS
jgi:hypothetical protein